MKTIREITCITCPVGCVVQVETEDGKILSMEGNGCARGARYVQAEVTAPVRMLTTTVRVDGGDHPLVAVKTAAPIPKELVIPSMKVLSEAVAKAPVHRGDIIVKNVLGSGVDIISTTEAGCA